MLTLCSTGRDFTGVMLLDCAPREAECIALFAASSAENRLKHLKGFRGAVFSASLCGRYAVEIVLWDNPASLMTARENPLLSEHIDIVEHHVKGLYAAFSSHHETCGDKEISFARGERFSFALHKPCTPTLLGAVREQMRSIGGLATARVLLHSAEDGAGLVLISKDAVDASAGATLPKTLGTPAFRDDFIVVEDICASCDAERFNPPYRLALATANV